MTHHYIISNFLKASKTFDVYDRVFKKVKADHCYQAIEIQTIDQSNVNNDELKRVEDFLRKFRQDVNAKSIVVSNPFKQTMFLYCDKVEGQAQQMGAVNLIIKNGSELVGENIDGDAFFIGQQNIKHFIFMDRTVLILGCGGVSTAVSFKLAAEKVKTLLLFDVDFSRTKVLAQKLTKTFPKLEIIMLTSESDIKKNHPDFIYNGTGIGKTGNNPEFITKTPIAYIPENSICIDANYTPWETKFLSIASNNGCVTLNGFSHMIAFTTLHLNKILDKSITFDDVYSIGKKVLKISSSRNSSPRNF